MTGPTVPQKTTLTRNDLAALLAHHADVLAARLRPTGADGAVAMLKAHSNALVAERESPAVTELLDTILSFDPAFFLGQPTTEGDSCPSC